MAVLSDSVPKEKIRSPKPKKKDTDSQQGNGTSDLDNSDGTRVVGGRIYDPVNGKTCHQCRQKTRDLAAACQNQKSNNKPCIITFCHKCLLNRYGEKVVEVTASGGWSCPKCRGICNCSVCMKKRGHQPTGILINMAKATGFSSVSEMLLKGRECSNNEKLVKDVATSKQDIVLSPRRSGKENSFDGKVDANIPASVDKKSKKVKGMSDSSVNDNVAPKMINQGPDKKKIKRKEHDCNTNNNEIGSPGSQKKPKKMKYNRSSDMVNENHVENDSMQANGHNDENKPKTSRSDGLGDHDTRGKTDSISASGSPIKLEACDKMLKKAAKQNRGVDFEENVSSGITLAKRDSVETSANDKKKAGGYGVNKKFLKNLNRQDADVGDDNLLPVGKDMTSLAGIDIDADDVGNALQFLEFCAVFGKILKVKKGEPECVLRDLFHGRTARRGKFSLTVQFHIHLLSILQAEQGNQSANLSPSYGKNSWFNVLKKSLSESLKSLKVHELDFLEKAADYESLDASKKLRILNFLCDEFLGTEKLRNWIDDKTTEHSEKIKEGKQKVLTAKDEEKSLKQRMKDEIAKATAAKNGDHLSFSELEAIASQFKSETAEARAKVLMSQDLLSKSNHACHALRVEPIFINSGGGDAYWKLNYSGKYDILRQNIGKGDSLASGEKWFVIDAEGREIIKKHVSLRRKRLRAPRVHSVESFEVEEIGHSS